MKHLIYFFLSLSSFFFFSCAAQDNSLTECNDSSSDIAQQVSQSTTLPFEVSINYPYLCLDKLALFKASTLSELDYRFKEEWIASYISVEISAEVKGNLQTASGKGHDLTEEQKKLIKTSDNMSPIYAKVIYIPKNNLKENDPKELEFEVIKNPEINAAYPGGYDQLLKYVRKNAIDKIPDGTYTGYAMSALTFKITAEGKATNLQLVDPFMEDENIEYLLKETISNMPNWSPAKFKDGMVTDQNFALIVGNKENCTLHLLNLDQ